MSRPRPKYVTFVLPNAYVEPIERLRDSAQELGLSLTGRQVIGRDGLFLAAMVNLLDLPLESQVKAIKDGVEKVQKVLAKPKDA